MIPRKEAKRLLEELTSRIAADLEESGVTTWFGDKSPEEHAANVLAQSDLVLRGAENVEQKARRYLVEGRVAVDQVDPTGGLVVATARGSEVYRLGYDPRTGGWRCTCRSGRRGRCSHIAALRLVVSARGPRA